MKDAPQFESFQILVSSGDNTRTTQYNVSLSGRYRLEIVGINTQFSSDPAYMRLQIVSPQLQSSKGNLRYYNYVYPGAVHSDTTLTKAMIFDPIDLTGQMTLCIENAATNAAPANFTESVITIHAHRVMDYPYQKYGNN